MLEQEDNARLVKVLTDAHNYAEHRLRVMLAEQDLRESELGQLDAKGEREKMKAQSDKDTDESGGIPREMSRYKDAGLKVSLESIDRSSDGAKMDVDED
jgi:hypothetical protein